MSRVALVVFAVHLLLCSVGITQYVEEDLELIVERAERGDAYYQGVLGAIYRRGERGEADLEEALKWLTLSAEQGDPIGLFNLGLMYRYGQGVDGDTVRAERLLIEALPRMKELSEDGNPRAQAALGTMYFYGLGVDRDIDTALQYMETSAEQGFPRAIRTLSTLYRGGAGVEQDYEKAFHWTERLAASGDEEAQYNLGGFYAFGLGVDEDFRRAVEVMSAFEGPNEVYQDWGEIHDHIIPDILPPRHRLDIEEGSCGEACLWSVLHWKGVEITQIEINQEAGFLERGLHADELTIPLREHNVGFINLSESVETSDSVLTARRYREFLYDDVVAAVKRGNPILIGVKVLPTSFPDWPLDHFVLVVGYNDTTNELIYNDFNHRKRVVAEKLLNQEPGYSFVNKYGWVYALEFSQLQE